MEYKITYSKRKTIGIYVHLDATVEVRCPSKTHKKVIEELIRKKEKWINKARNKMLLSRHKEFNETEKVLLIEKAKNIIPNRVEYFSKLMGVKPSGIRIGTAKSYWGCCNGNNKVIFSWRLMQASDEVIDYVVVHELAHIKEHNHSKRFWMEVEKVLPEYEKLRGELRKLNI